MNKPTEEEPALESVPVGVGQALPFFTRKQDALLGHLLVNEAFFKQARDRIQPEWFSDPLTSRLWKMAREWWEKYHRSFTIPEFKDSFGFLREDMGVRNKLYAKLTTAQLAAKDYGLDVIRSEMTLWLRSQTFKAYSEKAMDIYNAASDAANAEAKFSEAFRFYKAGALAVESAAFDADEAMTFDDVANGSFFAQREAELDNALRFGCPLVDKLLNREAKNDSSLVRGDHTIMLAPSGIGKTTTMITVARHNIVRGKSVLFLSHEGRPADIKAKMLQSYTGIRTEALAKMSMDPEGQKYLGVAARQLGKYLVYLPMNKAGLTVEEVEATIRRAQEKRIVETGRGFDLIIDDYPAILTTVVAQKGNWAKRQVDELVYKVFTQIALEFNCHVLTAIQTNREGSKVNRGVRGAEERLLVMEDVSESWGPMTTATNVISLNRDGAAVAANRLTFHICKSRSNETGWSIVTQTNYGISLTHGTAIFKGAEHKLLATYYRGIGTMSDQIGTLLEQFPDRAIPAHYYGG